MSSSTGTGFPQGLRWAIINIPKESITAVDRNKDSRPAYHMLMANAAKVAEK